MYDALVRMGLTLSQLRRSTTLLTRFEGSQVRAEGEIILLVTLGTEPHQQTFPIGFIIVQISSAYNAILGRPALNKFRATVSTYLLLVRFLTRNGVGEVKGDQAVAKQCLVIQDKQSDGSGLPWTNLILEIKCPPSVNQ